MRSVWLAVLLAVSGSATAVEGGVSLAPSRSEIIVLVDVLDKIVLTERLRA